MSASTDNELKRICHLCNGIAVYSDFWKGFICQKCGNLHEMHAEKEGNTEYPRPNKNVVEHMAVCTEMNALYARKNRDYGDSFHTSFEEEGMAMARIRLGDKLNRFKTLTKNGGQLVQDESIRDTLMDLANYSIMTIMEMDRMEGK